MEDPGANGEDRRKFLKLAGVVGASALAGCMGDDDDDDDDGNGTPDIGNGNGDDEPDEVTEGGTLRVGYEADLTGLDPHNVSSVVSWNAIYNICETLITFDDGEAVGRLADDYEVDGTTYTFHLKEGVQFHDGYGEMTAEDVVYSFDRMMDEDATTSPDLLATVEDVRAVDEYEVEVELQETFGPFIQYLARVHWVIVPEDAVEEQGGSIDDFQEPVGTGPFAFEEYTPDSSLVMSAFDDYHVEDAPHVDEVELVITPDADARVLAIQNDDLDFAREVPGRHAESLQNDDDTKVALSEATGWAMIHINCSEPPWDEPAVRRAAAHAIDRDAVIDAALFGFGSAGVQPFPEGNVWNYDIDNERWQDLEEAERILEDAGNPLEGETLEIKVTSEYSIQEAMGEIIQANFAEIGVDVELNNQEWGTHLNDFVESNFGALSFSVPYKVDPDRHYYGFLVEGGYNRYGDDQPDADRIRELLELGRDELDEDERLEIYGELEELVQEHVPWVSVAHTDDINGLRANVYGFEEWTLPYDRYWTMWIDE
ncbi:ABC transporter substrate-binding protein [Natrialbaceae archaeon A-CW3]